MHQSEQSLKARREDASDYWKGKLLKSTREDPNPSTSIEVVKKSYENTTILKVFSFT